MGQTATNLIALCQRKSSSISGRVDSSDWVAYLNEWIRHSSREFSLPWLRRNDQIYLYSGIYRYPVPSDFLRAILPEIPIATELRNDAWWLFERSTSLVRGKSERNLAAIQYDRGTKFFQFNYKDDNALTSVVLHECDSVTSNGTWAVSGGSNLTADDGTDGFDGPALVFDVTAAGTVTLTLTGAAAKDTSDQRDKVAAFFRLFLPVAGATAVALRWGSSASNYFELSKTTNFDGSAFRVGDNVIGFLRDDATETGTVDETAISYLRITITAAAVGNGYRIGKVSSKSPRRFDLPYYSNLAVLDNDGVTYKTEVVDMDDQLLGDDEFQDCAVYYAVMEAAGDNLKDADLLARMQAKFDDAFHALKVRHPDLSPKVQVEYFPAHLLP